MTAQILQEELIDKINRNSAPAMIDVRSGFEYHSGHIQDAVNVPFYSVFWNKKRLPKEKKELLVLICEHGPRAVMAKKLLGIIGYRNVRLLTGHMTEWKKNRLPVFKN